MRSIPVSSVTRVGLSVVLALACAPSAHAQVETFAAVANVAGDTPVTVLVQRYTSDRERKTLIEALKKGSGSARALLMKGPDLGSVQIGEHRTAIKYVYARPAVAGRQVTAVTAVPIVMGDQKPPAAGYDFGLVLLDLEPSGHGRGDLVAATKIRVLEDGAFETENDNGVVVHLSNVTAKKRTEPR